MRPKREYQLYGRVCCVPQLGDSCTGEEGKKFEDLSYEAGSKEALRVKRYLKYLNDPNSR
jgi:hypothetical protein